MGHVSSAFNQAASWSAGPTPTFDGSRNVFGAVAADPVEYWVRPVAADAQKLDSRRLGSAQVLGRRPIANPERKTAQLIDFPLPDELEWDFAELYDLARTAHRQGCGGQFRSSRTQGLLS